MGDAAITAAALYYLVASTLGVAALFLLVELVERGRGPAAGMLAVTAEAFGEGVQRTHDEEEEIGIAIPATIALLGVSFAGCALMLAGLPPLSGFVGKFLLLHALLALDPMPLASWAMLALLIVSGLAAMIAMARAGVRRFWASPGERAPRVRVIEMVPVLLLLVLCAALSVEAGSAMRYLDDAARSLHAPQGYVERVLGSP
jgi:multicomponent K+:H+ antiporter subunit D